MSHYAIGDLQGCANALDRLLESLNFDVAQDRIWLVGDLVNRGPESLRTLRTVRQLGNAATVVLGNHDLHLLGLACGARRAHPADTLEEVLAAPEANELIDWLRRRPLAHSEWIGDERFLMVHAGILPDWSLDDVLTRAGEVQSALSGDHWREFVRDLYGDQPDRWSDALVGHERLRVIVNSLTRLRFCSADGTLDLKTKEGIAGAPAGFLPWFDHPGRKSDASTVVFGHWSTLGLLMRPNLIGLDTGCVWGGALTAVRLENRALVQVACPQYRAPG